MGETILTKGNNLDELTDRSVQFEHALEMLCECWYESLETGSISYLRAIREITDMVEKCISKKKVSKQIGWNMIGKYAIQCRGVLINGPTNGIPSAFVTLLSDAKRNLPNPVYGNKHSNSELESMNENISIYERHSAKLKEFGMDVAPKTLKKWFETKSSPQT